MQCILIGLQASRLFNSMALLFKLLFLSAIVIEILFSSDFNEREMSTTDLAI